MKDSNSSPTEDFKIIQTIVGKNTFYNATGLTEQTTYYFKIKAFDEVPNYSLFSEVVNATIPDKIRPSAPTGLNITNVTNNSLMISWNANIEADIIGYRIYKGQSLTGLFIEISFVPVNKNWYVDSNLEEDRIYYYKIKAIDDADLESVYSEIISGKTVLSQRKPEINNSISDFKILEDTYDNTSINLYYWFKDINKDLLEFRCEGNEHINVSITQTTGIVLLIPDQNWNGKETITFYASDGYDEISDNITISILPENDPPEYVKIITPQNGIEITRGEKLSFRGVGNDPDLPYGDILTFYWISDIAGILGEGKVLKEIALPAGRHNITLKVTDNYGKESTATIEIRVIDKITPNNIYLFLASIIGIIIILIPIIFLIKKKKLFSKSVKKDDLVIQPEIEGIENSLVTEPIDAIPVSSQYYSIDNKKLTFQQSPRSYNQVPVQKTVQPSLSKQDSQMSKISLLRTPQMLPPKEKINITNPKSVKNIQNSQLKHLIF